MGEHVLGDGLDVVREQVVAPVGERARLRDPQERDPARGLAPSVEPRVAARVPQQRDDVAVRLSSTYTALRLVDRGEDLSRSATGSSESSGGSLVCSVSIRASSASGG